MPPFVKPAKSFKQIATCNLGGQCINQLFIYPSQLHLPHLNGLYRLQQFLALSHVAGLIMAQLLHHWVNHWVLQQLELFLERKRPPTKVWKKPTPNLPFLGKFLEPEHVNDLMKAGPAETSRIFDIVFSACVWDTVRSAIVLLWSNAFFTSMSTLTSLSRHVRSTSDVRACQEAFGKWFQQESLKLCDVYWVLYCSGWWAADYA